MTADRQEPKISVIIPSFNQGKCLRQCICSILAQNYSPLEIIIIDGGSTDHSVSIIREYESQLHYWISQQDDGKSDANNKGLEKASGDIIAWLNSDDFYLEDALIKVSNAYIREMDSSFYFGNGLRVDEEGNEISPFVIDNVPIFNQQALLFGLNYILQPSTFINARYLKRVKGIDSNLSYGMDSDLWIRLSQEAEPFPIQNHLAASREYGSTKTATGSFQRCEELRLISKKYTGLEITPGGLCYFLDTLHRFSVEHNDMFPEKFRGHLESFWTETRQLLTNYGCDEQGFPLVRQAFENTVYQTQRHKVRIGIDIRNVVLGQSGGISQIIIGIFETAFVSLDKYEYVVFGTIFNRQLLYTSLSNVSFFTLPLDTYYRDLDRLLELENIDILFRGYPIEASMVFPVSKQIFLIPDIQHETFPNFFTDEVLKARRKAFDQALKGAGAIITISEYARETLLNYPKTLCNDIFLTSPSLQKDYLKTLVNPPDELVELCKGRYFLYPANLWPHKNHRRLLQAFEQFISNDNEDIFLILTGHQKGWPALKEEFSHLPITHLGFVSPQSLQFLYKNAISLVFFSLYEGFGMPLLEAFEIGVPVICSNTTSLPEVGGDAVLSCDPTDIEASGLLMRKIAHDEHLRRSLIS